MRCGQTAFFPPPPHAAWNLVPDLLKTSPATLWGMLGAGGWERPRGVMCPEACMAQLRPSVPSEARPELGFSPLPFSSLPCPHTHPFLEGPLFQEAYLAHCPSSPCGLFPFVLVAGVPCEG